MSKTVGIIGAMQVEIDSLIARMAHYEKKIIKGLVYHVGDIEGQAIVMTQSSIGKVNATIATQMMLDHFKIDYVINTGIAGALDPKLKHLDVVISKELVYYDVRKCQMRHWFPKQPTFIADTELLSKTEQVVKEVGFNYYVGLIATGEDFVTQSDKKQTIFKEYQALCCEMEGCAIAHTAFVNEVPFIVIRTISDLANDAAEDDYAQFELLAAERSANIVTQLLRTFS
ncbi:MAG: 5'-methylthioadenosine/adenosylhomocysteine nucleosidase [Alcaligenaceae bacterium]|nr:5'-methylthioadenosine/adenosylhomocysteine nucleosidase [Alcaligenaceae bacterium]